MIITIWQGGDGGPSRVSTPFGDFKRGEVVKCSFEIGEWLIYNGLAQVARNWRVSGEKKAPIPIPSRVIG